MIFRDRIEAGCLLASQLDRFSDLDNLLVLGIPRGGMVIANKIAELTGVPLGIAPTRKCYPPNITDAFRNDVHLSINTKHTAFEHIQKDNKYQLDITRYRYRRTFSKISLCSKMIIVADDGIATGNKMQNAIYAIRSENPARIIVAVPVGARDSIERLSKDADAIICLSTPIFFHGVSQFYDNFEQITDAQIREMLNQYS